MVNKMNVMDTERIIDVPTSAAWAVIANLEGYADITTAGISRVEVLEGTGEGMIRRCTNDEGESWTETCPLWDEGREYRFIVNTDAPDYPYPIDWLEGRWSVEETPEGTKIKAVFRYQLKYGVLGRMMNLIAIRKFQGDVDFLMDKWTEKSAELAIAKAST